MSTVLSSAETNALVNLLVIQAQSGDSRAFCALVERHQAMVRTFLGRYLRDPGSVDDLAFVRLAFRQTLARDASDQEASACRRFLDDQATVLRDASQLTTFLGGEPSQVKPSDDPRQRARENLIHVLFNHNDFITVR